MSRNRSRRPRNLLKHAFERLENRSLLAVDLQLISNINVSDPWAQIYEIESVGSQSFFVASEAGQSKRDLWRTDGTTFGTIRLAELDSDAHSRYLTNVNGTLYFRGVDAAHGTELWKSDGTVAGTVMVRDLRSGAGSSVITNLRNFNGELYFSANGHLVRSNGTALGTRRVLDILPNADDGVKNLMPVGNRMYFSAKNATSGEDLYQTDGTAANTVPVTGAQGVSDLGNLVDVSGQLFFTQNNEGLWKTEGNGAIANLVSDVTSGPEYLKNFTNVDGILFFSHFAEIWKSDGTPTGTVPLTNVGDNALNFFNMDGTLYFSGGLVFFGDGYELWKSDGTPGGTVMVKDIDPGFNEGYGFSSYPDQFRKVQGKLYFIASGGVWTTDGTEAGTTPVEAGFHSLLDELDGDLLVARRIPYPLDGTQLWRRDPSLLAATEIERAGIGVANSDPSVAVNLDGVLYFAANDGVVGSELFKLDQGVVTLVKDINIGSGNSWIDHLTSINGALYFSAASPTIGNGLWRSDGTPTGTEFLAAVQPAADVGKPVFTQVGNELFFRGYDATGWELWKTDGTASGTMRVLDINPGSTYEYGIGFIVNSSHPSGFTNLNGTLYFSASDRVSGRELWKSDGTAAGTTLAFDLFPGRYPYYPYYLNSGNVTNVTGFKGALYFVGQNDVEGLGIWKSNGTLSGTEFVKQYDSIGTSTQNLLVVDDHIYFAGNAQGRGEELWRTDGTTAGTVLIKDIRLGARSSDIQQLTQANGRVYFTADDGTHGRELWVSDGTAAGTHMIRDIRTGIDSLNRPLSSNPNNLTNLNGTVYFTADDGVRGRELYKTNGTMGGASLVRDLVPGVTASDPKNLAAHNGAVYFSAKTNVGRELWQARAAAPWLRVSNSILSYVEDAPPLRLAASAILSDIDSPVLFGGEVRVGFTTPARVGDELSIGDIGDVTTVQNQVLYLGTVVGRFAGSVAGVPLSISLNQNASVAATQAIIRAITFASTSQNPFAGRRVIRFDVYDGDGAASLARYVRVDVTAVNDTPILTDATGDVNYQLNAALGVRIAREAIVSDVDSSNFEGGKLRIVVMGGDRGRNRLELLGTLFTIDASNNVLRNGVIIGTAIANAGVGVVPFEVTFNRNATPSIVQQLLRSLAFKTIGSTQTVNRSISISLTDGDGGPSANLQKSVIVS